MRSSPSSISTIPNDNLLEIFNLLPFQTLHKCRWVSRSWHSLITHELFPKIIQSQFLGFFHRIGINGDAFSYIEHATNNDSTSSIIVDLGLDFLPCRASTLNLLDCCNGLILYEARELDAYYVCSPVTRSWTVVTRCGFTPNCVSLDFDQWASPHFRLVAFSGHSAVSALVSMYCSGTKRWVEKKIVDYGVHAGSFQMVGRCTLWNRALYVDDLLTGSSAYGYTMSEEGCKVTRFLLSGSDLGFEAVEFPRGTKMPRGSTYIGRLGDKLGFAGVDGLQLRVWILSPRHENRWVWVHKGYISSPGELEGFVTLPRIVGFHPLRSAVLIFFGRVIFAYDLLEMSCVEICDIGSEAPVSIFPFLTCSSTLLENRSDH